MIGIPNLLTGASLLFWGWQTGNWIAALILALLLEATRHVPLRFDLGATEHAWIADLCTVVFVGLTVLLAVNRGITAGILAGFQWLPAALAPILLGQMLSERGRVPLSALFRYMRKLKRQDPTVRDPEVDTSGVYLAVILISAGVANARGPGYYLGIVAAAGWVLYATRPRHARRSAWAAAFAVSVVAGYGGYLALARAQAQVEDWIAEWYLRGIEGDADRVSTDIGTLGRLKLLDVVVARIYVPLAEADRVRLLHRASYNTYIGTSWLARGVPMQAVAAEPGGLTWTLGSAPPAWTTRIAARVERGRLLLALPSSTTRITGLGATSMKRNALGTVYAELPGDWIQYEAESAAIAETAADPGPEDLAVPAAERETLARLSAELGLAQMPVAQAIARVREHFSGFSYSTWREKPVASGSTPLADFLGNTRSGHCEYFAAATALLLRAAGIPARYSTGFAVLEYSPLEGAFLVRARHAHAWARFWDGSRWADLDTTPPSWFVEEQDALAPAWEKLMDLARWAAYRWSQRGEFEASDAWYGVLVVLIAVLAWRLLRGRRATTIERPSGASQRTWPGADSEFYAVERSLSLRARQPRDASLPLSSWLDRVGRDLDPPAREHLAEALRLHERYRFDPVGLDPAERGRLRQLCARLLELPTGNPAG